MAQPSMNATAAAVDSAIQWLIGAPQLGMSDHDLGMSASTIAAGAQGPYAFRA